VMLQIFIREKISPPTLMRVVEKNDLCTGNNYVLLISIEVVENIKKEFFRLPYIRIASNSIKYYLNANWRFSEEKGV